MYVHTRLRLRWRQSALFVWSQRKIIKAERNKNFPAALTCPMLSLSPLIHFSIRFVHCHTRWREKIRFYLLWSKCWLHPSEAPEQSARHRTSSMSPWRTNWELPAILSSHWLTLAHETVFCALIGQTVCILPAARATHHWSCPVSHSNSSLVSSTTFYLEILLLAECWTLAPTDCILQTTASHVRTTSRVVIVKMAPLSRHN